MEGIGMLNEPKRKKYNPGNQQFIILCLLHLYLVEQSPIQANVKPLTHTFNTILLSINLPKKASK